MSTPKPYVKLYVDPLAVPALACLWACMINDPQGEQVEIVYIDLLKGEHRTPAFLALNPLHTVPVLHDTKMNLVLTETVAIFHYLSERFIGWTVNIPPSAKDGAGRFKVINYLSIHLTKVRTKFYRTYFGKLSHLAPSDTMDKELVKTAVKNGKKWLGALEKMLEQNGGFVACRYVTMADLLAFIDIAYNLDEEYDVNVYTFKGFFYVTDWLNRVRDLVPKCTEIRKIAKEAVQKAKASKVLLK